MRQFPAILLKAFAKKYRALVILLIFIPSGSALAGGSILMEKPSELLPRNTQEQDYGTYVQLKGVKNLDIMKVIAEEPPYNMSVFITFGEEVSANAKIWHQGAVHEIINDLEMAGFQFRPDEGSFLKFRVEKEEGYVLNGGNGSVMTPEGETVKVNEQSEGIKFGVPAE